MADVFDFYVQDDRKISFEIAEPIMLEDNHVTDLVFHIPKVLNNLDVSTWAWWLVYVNAKGEKYTEPLQLSDDPERPTEYNIATYSVDYGMSIKAGTVSFAVEGINAESGGTILNEWHTFTYQTTVKETLQGNQVEYAETESDIISALLIEVQNKFNQIVGGATPLPVSSVSEMTDTTKVYLNTTDKNWYFYNGSAWVSGGLYASGIVIDSTLTQSGQAADAKAVGDKIEKKVSKPVSSPNGTAGQLLRTNGDGTTQWVNQGLPTDEQTAEAIDEWLTDHPEATTTVQDGSLTYKKLVTGTLGFVTPEMYGAKGDGVTDDTSAIQAAINSGKNVLFSGATYVCGRVVIRNSNIILDGNLSTLLHGAGYGFVISKDAHDVEIRNFNSICTYEKDSQAETNVHIQIGADNDNPDSEYFAYNITVKNCSFYGGVDGFSATSVKNILIENCKFDGFIYKPEDVAGGYGILLQSCINVKIVFCDFLSGAYGRHDIYVSVDQRKTQYKRNKNITIDSCSFDHSELVLVDGTNFYSSITVPINVRASSKVTVTNSHFYSVTGAVNFFATNGEIDSATVKNCIIDTPVYNSGASEIRYIIGVMGTSDNHITADVFGITLANVPEAYTNFVSLKNCDANVYACNIKKTNIVCYENVLLHLWDIITTFTSYFIRFVGGDETKGFCENISFLNRTLSPSRYYFSEGSSAGIGFYDTVQIRVTLPDTAGFTDWAELPDGMNPEKCYCSGIGLLYSSGRRFGQGTNSASARIFVELGTDGYRVYNGDSQYFNTRPYIYISPIPGS